MVVSPPSWPLYWWPPKPKGQRSLPLPLPLPLESELPEPSSTGTVTSRLSAETTPLVTVPESPSGEPMATTGSPTARPAELPSWAAFSPLTPLALITARSLDGSVATTFAVAVRPSLSAILTLSAPATTWLLVRIVPSAVRITPEPMDWPSPESAVISTTLGPTAAATAATLPPDLAETGAPATGAAAAVLCVAPPISAAVPPPTTPDAIATATSNATGRRARRRGSGTAGSCPAAPGWYSGRGGYQAPAAPLPGWVLSCMSGVMPTTLAALHESSLSAG
ncbi:protein of unknown function [Streptantibioticus cattleyicolor NRRL 8057 = DSM 46488]|nr:protein of unknown function [Streptantibioticus cattleyicolor NRRL 8057 = DSM 46488]